MRFEPLQLKVCEGCGSLWFRSVVVGGVYCCACADKLAQFPRLEQAQRAGRKRKVVFALQAGAL